MRSHVSTQRRPAAERVSDAASVSAASPADGAAEGLREFVRDARASDDEALARLDTEWRAAARAFRGAARMLAEDPHRLGFVTLRGLSGWRVVVAGLDGAVLGALGLAMPGPIATISRVYVTAEARGLGLGEAMVDGALERAGAAGCRSVDALALPGDRETKNLFERVGLVSRLIVATRDLADRDEDAAAPAARDEEG
jgi:ribosomal protein S18 acetylase RimI-like enzyme